MEANNEIILQEINLLDLYQSLLREKIRIIVFSSIIALSSIIYSLQLPNIYTSSITLVDSKQIGGLATAASGLGGFASMVGVNIDSLQGGSKTEVALELMTSWAFIEKFIRDNSLEAKLSAVKGWDKNRNELIYNTNLFDPLKKKWLKKEPSSYDLYKGFSSRLKVNRDKLTGIIKVSIDYYSPQIAREWVQLFADSINLHMRDRQLKRSNSNIEYLKEEINKTSVSELKEVFYNLIAEETKTKMIASASSESTFIIVSSAMIPQEKTKPRRSIIVITATLLAGFSSICFFSFLEIRKQFSG